MIGTALMLSLMLSAPGHSQCDRESSLSGHKTKITITTAWSNPIRSKVKINSGYGRRMRQWHHGIDIEAPIGTSVRAVAAGKVWKIGHDNLCGDYVVVIHDGGLSSNYCHLSKIFVAEGQHVVGNGRVIALSGNSGLSTGPHLHLGAYQNGVGFVDPTKLLDIDQ